MKKIIILSFLILFKIFIDYAAKDNTIGKIDSEFLPYISEFKKYAKIYNKNIEKLRYIDILFDNNDPESDKNNKGYVILAYCSMSWKDNKILFYRKIWDNMNYYEREQILFHELGHCLLDRLSHKNDLINIEDGTIINDSIMNSIFNGDYKTYIKYKKNYINELFTYNFYNIVVYNEMTNDEILYINKLY